MKTENKNNELVLGNKDNASSHYRINSEGTKIQLMATVEGAKPFSKCEFLMCSIGYRSEFITAYMEANKPTRLFKLVDYVDWECNGKQVYNVEIPFEDYINPTAFLKVVAQHFLFSKASKAIN